MKELSYASLLSQTANGAVDLMVATIPKDVMHAFQLEATASSPLATRKDQTPVDAAVAPWRTRIQHQICSHGLTHPRPHLLAVAGLLVTGAFLLYMTALHMGYLSSEEASLLSTVNQRSLPYVNISRGSSPPTYLNDSSVDANFSAGDSALNYTSSNFTADESSQMANVSIPAASPKPSPPPTPETIGARICYQNMSETWHTMSDRKLLRKASSVPPLRTPHAARVAYMFMARGLLPFAPLWERYFRGHEQLYSIYIHAHPDYVPTFAPTSPFFRRFIPSKVVEWGKLSVYEAERRLLGNALLDQRNEWFLLFSESCIPIFNFPETYAYLNHSQGISFIESYVDRSRLGQGRLYRGNFKAMEPEITGENFRKGSQWVQINRDLALLAAAESKEYAKFEQYFCQIRSKCYIDEHFLPTFAWIVRPHAIAFRTLTYYEFPVESPHPKTYDKGKTDVNLILGFRGGHSCTYNGQTTSKCYLFMRKFDPDALDVLLDLAGPVMGIP